MTFAQAFWRLLAWACLVWYSTLTVYVAWKGVRDIRRMLHELHKRR